MLRPRLLKAGALFVLSVLIATAGASAQTLQKVRIRLDWKSGAQHAPFYYGAQLGYYKDAGIDLEIISVSGSSDTVKQVGSGAIAFGLVCALRLAQAAQQRLRWRSIPAYYHPTPIVVITPKEKPVTKPAQLLEGVKLGSKK